MILIFENLICNVHTPDTKTDGHSFTKLHDIVCIELYYVHMHCHVYIQVHAAWLFVGIQWKLEIMVTLGTELPGCYTEVTCLCSDPVIY